MNLASAAALAAAQSEEDSLSRLQVASLHCLWDSSLTSCKEVRLCGALSGALIAL